MARFLSSRLAKLENKASRTHGTRVAVEYECDAKGRPTSPDFLAWLATPAGTVKSPQRPGKGASRPLYARKVILVPSFGSVAAWEAACLAQQKALQAVSRSRTNKPAQTAPSVGTKSESINEVAPIRPGAKKGRFIEMNDGRTFDRENGEFI